MNMKTQITLFMALLMCLASNGQTGEFTSSPSPISVRDAIAMVRIYDGYKEDFGAFSPDGSKFVTVVYSGILENNVNRYLLLAFDINAIFRSKEVQIDTLLSIDFKGNLKDQAASPIADLKICDDNRTVVFLGSIEGEPNQVYAVDLYAKAIKRLTPGDSEITEYNVSGVGDLTLFAVAEADPTDSKEEDGAGIFPYERKKPNNNRIISTVVGNDKFPDLHRKYYLPKLVGAPTCFFDSRNSKRTQPTRWDLAMDTSRSSGSGLSMESEYTLKMLTDIKSDPTGNFALLWPYVLSAHSIDTLAHSAWDRGNVLVGKNTAAYFGLIDLKSGDMVPLLDQLYSPLLNRSGGMHWSPDGKSVLIKTLLPLNALSVKENEKRKQIPPVWLEVQVPSRQYSQVDIPDHWKVIRWDNHDGSLYLRRGDSLARMEKTDEGWKQFQRIGVIDGFNKYRSVVTDGKIAIGVRDSLTTPPDLMAYDIATGKTRMLTDLNPHLRQREYGAVEQLRFSSPYDTLSTGWLIKPVGYRPDKRYPLVVLHKDAGERGDNTSFLIDGDDNLSGHAIQPLAASGIMVLFMGEPRALWSKMGTPAEGDIVTANTVAAVRALVERGLVDSARVGVSGWSRAAYYVDYGLIHSDFRFAAASAIDGGSREYNDFFRPYSDSELDNIRTPLLFQPHGLPTAIAAGEMANRLYSKKKPVDMLYFPTAAHSTIIPLHRLQSLSTHVDWWRFWLQDYEDPDPTKEKQYQRWRKLKGLQGETQL